MLPFQLRAQASTRDGQTLDVTKAQHGTVYETSAPAVVSVSEDGELLAHQIGDAVIRIRHRGLETAVQVSARWDSPLIVQQPSPDSTGRLPRLEPDLERFQPGGVLSLRVKEGPPDTAGRVLVALRPANPALPAPPQQNFVVPLETDAAGTARVEYPVPETVPQGAWFYVQAFFGGAPTSPEWCSTDGHIVTVR